MNGRQIIIDILVVVLMPLMIVAAYYFWKEGDTSLLLSSVTLSGAAKPGEDEAKELGAKIKLALATLNTIKLDNSIFTDPVYQSLRDFPVTIATTTLGRDYPFTLPEGVREK